VEKIRTNRADSRLVACPVCGAEPGEPCVRDAPSHAARHAVAVAHGAPRTDEGAPKGVPGRSGSTGAAEA